jgi:hypothetical protein
MPGNNSAKDYFSSTTNQQQTERQDKDSGNKDIEERKAESQRRQMEGAARSRKMREPEIPTTGKAALPTDRSQKRITGHAKRMEKLGGGLT